MATCAIPATQANVISSSNTKGRDYSQINLVKRAQAGDEHAFATLFQQHKNRVYSVCLLMTKDVAEAEDLTRKRSCRFFGRSDRSAGTPHFRPGCIAWRSTPC